MLHGEKFCRRNGGEMLPNLGRLARWSRGATGRRGRGTLVLPTPQAERARAPTESPGRIHARRHQQRGGVRSPPSSRRRRNLRAPLPRRPREPGPLRTPARRHGRWHLVALQDLHRRAAIAVRRGRGLYVRPGRGGPPAGRLEQQLRQHVLGHRPLRGGRGIGRSARTRRRRAHPQHQYRRSSSGPAFRWRTVVRRSRETP